MYDTITFQVGQWEAAGRLGLALLCAALVGLDRETRNRGAGLRTHMMVALGSAGFTLVAMKLFAMLDVASAGGNTLGGDPVRIMAAIVGGIGFLGAGTIIQSGGEIRGMTTAAGLWVIAAVGMAAGAGYYSGAVMITVLALVTIVLLRRVERWIPDRDT